MPGRHAMFLTHEPALPMISGTRVRSLNLMRELVRRGWRVSLFSLVPDAGPSSDEIVRLEELCDGVALEHLPASPARRLRVGWAIARGRAFHESYFFSARAAERLRRFLERESPDVIVTEQLYMYPYVPPEYHKRTVLDCHNVEQWRLQTMASALWPRPRAIAARVQLRPVRRLEVDAVTRVASVLAVSESECRYFESLAPGAVSLVPNGVECDRWRARTQLPKEPTFLFAGNLNYSANLDAARYLIREILPRMRRSDATLTIIGGDPPRRLRQAAGRSPARIRFEGLVPDTERYFARSRFLVVPVRFGGGTPLKVLEGLARGVPVLSTSGPCAGLDLVPERDILIADEPQRFAACIDRLLEDDEMCGGLARNGRAAVERHYDWRWIGDKLERALTCP